MSRPQVATGEQQATAPQPLSGSLYGPDQSASETHQGRPVSGISASGEVQRFYYDLPTSAPSAQRLLSMSTDSGCTTASSCNSSVANSIVKNGNDSDSSKKKNWVLNSFGKAFSRKKARTNSISEAELEAAESRTCIFSDGEDSPSQVNPLLAPTTPAGHFKRSYTLPSNLGPEYYLMNPGHSRTPSAEDDDSDCPLSPVLPEKDDLVQELQRQLDERDSRMHEIRQEALSSVSQLQQLTSIVMEMQEELASLKAENDRLQRLVTQDVADVDMVSSTPVEAEAWGMPVAMTASNDSRHASNQASGTSQNQLTRTTTSATPAAVPAVKVAPESSLQLLKHHV